MSDNDFSDAIDDEEKRLRECKSARRKCRDSIKTRQDAGKSVFSLTGEAEMYERTELSIRRVISKLKTKREERNQDQA